MTPAAQTMTPTTEEMAAFLDREAAFEEKPIGQMMPPPAALKRARMLRAIAERLRMGRHG